MGNSLQPTAATQAKHVVIVGCSYSGFAMAELLWDHFKITVIEQNDYFEHVIANVKCQVDLEFIDKTLYSFEKVAATYPKINFKQATLINVGLDDTVEVHSAKQGTNEFIKFDYLILSTGFSYDRPIKDVNSLTLGDRR